MGTKHHYAKSEAIKGCAAYLKCLVLLKGGMVRALDPHLTD